MTNQEFSNEFDVLYNNITSNQSPGLDEYEKSVFLTKAQDEVVKAYFNPVLNKSREGFDGNEKRQIDFSMIMRSTKYEALTAIVVEKEATGNATYNTIEGIKSLITNGKIGDKDLEAIKSTGVFSVSTNTTDSEIPGADIKVTTAIISPFLESFFDYRENTRSVIIDSSILMFVNEYVTVDRNDKTSRTDRLTVVPINYTEYSRLMSKPFKRPLKFQAWRILDNSASTDSSSVQPVKKVELVIGPNDSIESYVVRYVKRPRAIRLINFDDNITLDGGGTLQECELDPILHQEILQRAVELAKAAYAADANSRLALGQSSQTDVGMVTQSSGNR